jgi:hypothetical protein
MLSGGWAEGFLGCSTLYSVDIIGCDLAEVVWLEAKRGHELIQLWNDHEIDITRKTSNSYALPALWLQAKLTISLTSTQDKFAKLFMTIAAAARNFTIRLAEK